jgi:hypothetical protein
MHQRESRSELVKCSAIDIAQWATEGRGETARVYAPYVGFSSAGALRTPTASQTGVATRVYSDSTIAKIF